MHGDVYTWPVQLTIARSSPSDRSLPPPTAASALASALASQPPCETGSCRCCGCGRRALLAATTGALRAVARGARPPTRACPPAALPPARGCRAASTTSTTTTSSSSSSFTPPLSRLCCHGAIRAAAAAAELPRHGRLGGGAKPSHGSSSPVRSISIMATATANVMALQCSARCGWRRACCTPRGVRFGRTRRAPWVTEALPRLSTGAAPGVNRFGEGRGKV
eukprot:104118-Chlamydomonas_euryale.AAC.1